MSMAKKSRRKKYVQRASFVRSLIRREALDIACTGVFTSNPGCTYDAVSALNAVCLTLPDESVLDFLSDHSHIYVQQLVSGKDHPTTA